MHPNTERVVAALRAAGCDSEVVELTEPARTAADAAALVGVDVAQIANSLVFTAGGEPILVMTSGANRVDTAALGERLGAPVGHATPLRIFVDEDLLGHDVVWAAGGTPHTLFRTSGAELLRVTGGTPVRVTP